MLKGINFITNEKGQTTGLILDTVTFKAEGISAASVMESLAGLQDIIDASPAQEKKKVSWDAAKSALNKLKDS